MGVLQTVKALRKTSSSNEKKEILRKSSPIFQEVLKATYDPFKVYHIRQILWKGVGHRTVDDTWAQIYDMLEYLAQNFGDDACKAMLAKNIVTLDEENAEILKCIVKKDLKAGISATTINSVFPDLIPAFGAMKAKRFEDKRWDPGLMGSVKLDGLRCQVLGGELYSMNGHKLTGLSHIEKAAHGLGDMDSELLIPGKNFQTSSGLIRSYNNCPDAVLCVFDHISQNRPFAARYDHLTMLASAQGWSTSVLKPTTITLVKHNTFKDIEAMYAAFDKILAAGFEGLMLKTPDHYYQRGKRTYDWMKVKNVLDADLHIEGFFEGQGKYEGQLGGVIVLVNNGVEVRVGSGFSDQERVDIWNNKEVYLGKVIEVQYHEETPDGSLRHPRFKRFRGDKD